MSDCRALINQYLTDFETNTTNILELIHASLNNTGQTFDERIRGYFIKGVKNRLEQTLEFFEINRDRTLSIDTEKEIQSSVSLELEYVHIKSEVCSDDEEVNENSKITENADGVSTSNQLSSETNPVQNMVYIDQQSSCSPSTTNVNIPCVFEIKSETSDESNKDSICSSSDVAISSMCIEDSNSNVKMVAMKRSHSAESQDSIKKCKLDKTTKLPDNITISTSGSQQFCHIKLKLVCFYCQAMAECKNMSMIPFNTIDELKIHFAAKHSTEKNLFYAVKTACCFYCDKIDTYARLKNHQNFRHNGMNFLIVDEQDRSQCGICHRQFLIDEMQLHFKTEHESALLIGIFSPICIIQNEIEQLINIKIQDENNDVAKLEKFICGHCNTDLCGTEASLKRHFESTTFNFQCSKCELVANNLEYLIQHETKQHSIDRHDKHIVDLKARLKKYYYRTRVVFSNGLVLFMHNMLSTSFDFRNEFWSFINEFVNIKFGKQKPVLDKQIGKIAETLAMKPNFREIELRKQREYRNNLCITGIVSVGKDHLPRIFLNICSAISALVSLDDIETIFQRSEYDIIVKLKKWDTKKNILKQWEQMDADECTHKLRMISFMQKKLQPTALKITNDMTPFFKNLWNCAEAARISKHIFTFWISWHGLTVKTTPLGSTKVIWSKSELYSN